MPYSKPSCLPIENFPCPMMDATQFAGVTAIAIYYPSASNIFCTKLMVIFNYIYSE